MRRTLTAVAALAATAAMLAAVAAAGPVATKQRVAIEHKGASFVLTPLTPGAVKADAGPISFCCWTERHTMRDGQDAVIDNPLMTLNGKRGTLVARNEIGYVDVTNGWAVFTGTWKVIRGTGQYAGLAGGGRGAGVARPNGNTTARFEGFLGAK